ncbi:MAG TPA: hypothetical protein VKJ07_22890, partial [Mycobacteriales bacterium]|nr:hypothetical protein [Mycobacteriales bacterium]
MYGWGAQSVRFVVPTANGSPFVAGTGVDTTHTHVVFDSLPAGVHVVAEAASAAPNVVMDTLNIDPATTTTLTKVTFHLVNPDGGTSGTCSNATTGGNGVTTFNKDNSCLLAVDAAPTVGSVAPNTFVAGASNQGLTITGTNFHGGSSGNDSLSTADKLVHVTITPVGGGASYVDGDFTPFVLNTVLQVNVTGITVPVNAPAGDADIIVTNNDDKGTVTCSACFHVSSLSVDGVQDQSTLTNADTNGGPANLTVIGKNFASDVTLSLQQPGVASIPLTNVQVTSPDTNSSSATGTVDLRGVAPGWYALVASNAANDAHPGSASLAHAFQVLANAPTATNVSPN